MVLSPAFWLPHSVKFFGYSCRCVRVCCIFKVESYRSSNLSSFKSKNVSAIKIVENALSGLDCLTIKKNMDLTCLRKDSSCQTYGEVVKTSTLTWWGGGSNLQFQKLAWCHTLKYKVFPQKAISPQHGLSTSLSIKLRNLYTGNYISTQQRPQQRLFITVQGCLQNGFDSVNFNYNLQERFLTLHSQIIAHCWGTA